MPLIFAAIAPHGSQAVFAPNDKPEAGKSLRQSLSQLGSQLAELAPQCIVLLTPHGIRTEGAFAVSYSQFMEGALREGDQEISGRIAVDKKLASHIIEQATMKGIPAVGVGYGAASGPHSTLPLDWGSLIPLHYMGLNYSPQPEVVIINPSRALSWADHVRFGEMLGHILDQDQGRTALIVSADLAHTHQAEGPYGYHPAAVRFDAWFQDVIQKDKLDALITINQEEVAHAKPDALWQALILAGVNHVVPLKGAFLTYECPTYFGMLTARYSPA